MLKTIDFLRINNSFGSQPHKRELTSVKSQSFRAHLPGAEVPCAINTPVIDEL